VTQREILEMKTAKGGEIEREKGDGDNDMKRRD
jgi:hypothetical protein